MGGLAVDVMWCLLQLVGSGYVQMRKARKVSSVMGWLLSLQLSEPGAGSCCAFSMVLVPCGCAWCWGKQSETCEDQLHVAFSGTRRRSAFGGSFGGDAGATSPHVIG